MIALGLANFLGSFFKSIPTCGAFTRSAVSNASGVQTTFSGIYSAAMALLALTLLTPYFNYIPKTTLAAILICAVLSLVCSPHYHHDFMTDLIKHFRLTSTLESVCGKLTKSTLPRGSDALLFVLQSGLKSGCFLVSL